MDFSLNSWGDIATFSAVLAGVLGFLAWLAKGWINRAVEAVKADLEPHLTNGETSVAVYAHQARDAALDAKTAALDAKDAARSAAASADHISLAVERIDQRLKSLAPSQEKEEGK